MTTQLTEIGWVDKSSGRLLGRWSNQPNVVDRDDEITVASGVTANSLAGGDIITGFSSAEYGDAISNDGIFNTGPGKDRITATSSGPDGDGIINVGTINTGPGNDRITATADDDGIFNVGTINTGPGNDRITTMALYDIFNSGTINTGPGNDTVDTLTGNGRFLIVGERDVGRINLGAGCDLIRGFGEQIVNGGQGFDTAELGIDYDEITLSNALGSSIDITFDSATMAFTNVDLFVFSDVTYTLQQLQEQATI
jgi:hypothetical protein